MPTLNVDLTPALAKFVQEKVDSGEYRNASDLVRDALRLLSRDDRLEAEKLDRLRQEIALGIDDADQGHFATRSLDEIADSVLRDHGVGRS
ncbi:type II toxin-antitoxin system ParD family antitoxin [Azospirillum rugosum]|uniref:Antitoxin ParD1/3/4 n=1 Tax=Azospirillum rugosum TaxID=416170 RepID=A0ABS4SG61_9PROT|nr:type II toxin-antitoxin system ParD family antitoxin [Azospirillum rugosum]MBP2291549.1 antitoxin ParD1/3/4 [Azospirillum rugosum]MDQ0525338.1 antitoxin ParD1/3/4 [Azospirillum rugosum]